MLRIAASMLLAAAVVSGVGGPLATVGAALVWLVARVETRASAGALPERGDGAGVWLGVALVVATLAIRWPIAQHDVEHYPGPDEGEIVENVLEMIRTGDFDQRHPGYPGLHFYLQMLPARAHLAATGKTISELPRSGFYLRARRLTLVAGALVVGVVVWIGRRWLSGWGVTLAASLVALSPLAFRESAVVNPDLVLSLFVLVSLGLSLSLLQSRSWLAFGLAGVSIGLASAIKYTGVFTVVPFSLAWLAGSTPKQDAVKWVGGGAIAGLAFVLASPYTVLNLAAFVRGLSMHVGYYQAADLNAPYELTRQLATRGVGIAASMLALVAAVRALSGADQRLLVLLGYPLAYWFVFSFFDRAFPRHALVLVPVVALLAADTVDRTRRPWLRLALTVIVVAGPLLGSVDLWRRARRETPADAARSWVLSTLPPGSRILQDQYTPNLGADGYDVHRLRVEEKRFVGNYDWVLRSGYPPGLSPRGLREVARFDNDRALGDLIVAYEVPERASLMPTTLGDGEPSATIGAGELPFFGEGWYPPSAGAFETSRLSRGDTSEIFFELEEAMSVNGQLVLGAAVDEGALTVTLNGADIAEVTYEEEREAHAVSLPARAGLNRLELRYDATKRLNRRHRDTAIRFYRLELRREGS